MGKRTITGLYLTPDGGMDERGLELQGRTLLSKAEKSAWMLPDLPLQVAAARRGKFKELVIVTDEHMVPVRLPWQDPTAPTPEQNAFFRERNRRLAGYLAKKANRTDLLLTMNMVVLAVMAGLFAFVTIAYVDFGGLIDKLPF